MTSSLELAMAEQLVNSYVFDSEQWQTDHRDAMECWDCQEWLQKGIDAFRWLQRAEEAFTQAEFHGVHEMTIAERDAIEALYTAWLVPHAATEEWITTLAERGYSPDNLNEFRGISEEAQRIVADRGTPIAAEPASCADLAMEGFRVTSRDARAAAELMARKQATYRGTLSDHGIIEE